MPKTLLLADDSVTIQKVVGITFANEDIDLVTVDNGDAALEKAREVRPDLVLADISMPGLSGYELCAALKAEAMLAHVPVILLSGTFESYDPERTTAVGADGHIAKPFEAQALVDLVHATLERAAKRAPGAAAASGPPELTLEPEAIEPAAAPEPPAVVTDAKADAFAFADLDFGITPPSGEVTRVFATSDAGEAQAIPATPRPAPAAQPAPPARGHAEADSMLDE